MNKFLLTLLCAPLFLQSFPYTVEEDMQRSVRASHSLTLELEEIDLVIAVDGEEREIPQAERTQIVSSRETLEYTDTISQLDGDQPTRIQRSFETLSMEETQKVEVPGQDPIDAARSGTSAFEGETALLVRDEEGDWSSSIEDDEELDQETLDGLTAHFGFKAFLPEDLEAELGDEWEIPLEAYAQLRNPAGLMSFEFDEESPFPSTRSQFTDNLEGEMNAKWVAYDEEEGLATIELLFELSTHTEVEVELSLPGAEGEMSQAMEVEFELSGELIWDMQKGALRSISVEGSVESDVLIIQALRPDEAEFTERIATQRVKLSGEIKHELRVE